jgi:carbonic anhydrase
MSSCNAPIDISPNASVACSNRCEFKFNYSQSDCAASAKTNYLSLSYKKGKQSNFNKTDYSVDEIRIYRGPIHSYGSNSEGTAQTADAELIIIHKSNTKNKILYVCIPIIESNLDTVPSEKLKYLVTNIQGTQSINIKDFYNLNDFVSKTASFYTYSASSFLNCAQPADYIVYHPNNHSIPILPSIYDILKNVINKNVVYKPITNFNSTKITKPVLYFNSKGSGSGGKIEDDQIYIDCQPVNKSEEKVTVNKEMIKKNITFSSLQQNQYFQLIFGFLIFIIILYISYYSIEITTAIFKFIKNPSSSAPPSSANLKISTK